MSASPISSAFLNTYPQQATVAQQQQPIAQGSGVPGLATFNSAGNTIAIG